MSDNLKTISQNQLNGEGRDTNFLDYLAILLRWRRFIIINFLIVSVLAVGISFLLPKWYKATASILPPKDQGLLNLLGTSNPVLKGLSSLSKLGVAGQNSGADNYFSILQNPSMMEDVVGKFNLIPVYDTGGSSMEETGEELRRNTSFG